MKIARFGNTYVASLAACLLGVVAGCSGSDQEQARATTTTAATKVSAPAVVPSKQAQPSSPKVSSSLPPGVKIRRHPKTQAEMVWIPAGPFKFGPDRKTLTLPGFWIARNPVTVAEFRAYCKATKYAYDWSRKGPGGVWQDDHPMVKVSWDEASGYCKWAGGSLPTEEQWEKAARGSDGRVYPWGDEFDALRCQTSVRGMKRGTSAVGSFPAGASPYGVLDMAGNVCQWTATWSDSGRTLRVIRGGSWHSNSAAGVRSDNKGALASSGRLESLGFRLAETP